MIATVGHSLISLAASLKQSSGTTVSLSTINTISPILVARPFAAQGRHFCPLSSHISWIARPRAFSSRSSSPKWERSCSCWREGGEWRRREGGLEGKDVLNLGVLGGLRVWPKDWEVPAVALVIVPPCPQTTDSSPSRFWYWIPYGMGALWPTLELGLPSGAFEESEWRLARLAAALVTSISKCFSVFKDNVRAIKLSAQLFSRGGAKNLYHNSYSKLSWISLPSWIRQV